MLFRPIRPVNEQANPSMGLYMNWNSQNASPALGSFISMLDFGAPKRFSDTLLDLATQESIVNRELHR
ncbi:hypothetical protein D3C77_819310 [compost metagenome]